MPNIEILHCTECKDTVCTQNAGSDVRQKRMESKDQFHPNPPQILIETITHCPIRREKNDNRIISAFHTISTDQILKSRFDNLLRSGQAEKATEMMIIAVALEQTESPSIFLTAINLLSSDASVYENGHHTKIKQAANNAAEIINPEIISYTSSLVSNRSYESAAEAISLLGEV